jgi:hypothetical protein
VRLHIDLSFKEKAAFNWLEQTKGLSFFYFANEQDGGIRVLQ